jgi:hypothetical protein
MNLFNYLIHRVIQQLCYGCNKAKEVRHNTIQQKDSSLKPHKSFTSKWPFMRSRVGVEKFRVDAHAILHTCNGVKVVNIEHGRVLQRINRVRTQKKISIVTYSEAAAQSPSPPRHNRQRSRTSYSTAVQGKDYEPRYPRVPRRCHLPGRGSGHTLLDETELAVADQLTLERRHRAPTATPALADWH